jgi:mannosyltransferase
MDGSATEARPAYGDVDPAVPGGDREGDRGENGNGTGAGAPWPTVLSGRWLLAAEIGVVAVVAIGLVLRFWTRSALWLDEALTVDIARLPLHEIPSYLKRDGAPPLYYVLLHFWMKPFGDSDIAVRSLSGVFSVATLPVVWIVGRRIGGRSVAWVLLVVVASAPFAVYYGTEARMYSLVMFLTACGLWALSRVLEKARPGNLVALAVVTAALLYSQYWALYLVGSLGLWLLWQLWRGRPEWRSHARWAFGAVVVGCLAFAPWVPTFLYQSRYTGTPWAGTPTYAAIINAITGFTDNQASNAVTGSNQGRLLALGYFALAGLGLFGAARGRWHIDLDIRTRPQGRGLAFAVVVTLAAAITGGILSQSAFSARYAAVVFIPLLALLALGTMTFADARFRAIVVAVVALAGVAASIPNVTTQRTQAPAVAATLAAHAQPGDIVAYCPDQLGPAVYRLTASKGYDQITFPRGTPPAYIDWVDYKNVAEASHPAPFAEQLEAMAGHDHDIWLVSAPQYQGFNDKCQILAADLLAAPGYGGHQWVNSNPQQYYEPMGLTQFAPPGAP